MAAKFVFLIAVTAFIWAADKPNWTQTRRWDKSFYAAMFVPAAYLGVIFVTEAPLPNLDDLFGIFFVPAKQIVSLFRPSQ